MEFGDITLAIHVNGWNTMTHSLDRAPPYLIRRSLCFIALTPEAFTCHVCRKIARKKGPEYIHQRGWSVAAGGHCVLCNHDYCTSHGSKRRNDGGVDVCEISHVSYFNNHKWKPKVYPTLRKFLEETRWDGNLGYIYATVVSESLVPRVYGGSKIAQIQKIQKI